MSSEDLRQELALQPGDVQLTGYWIDLGSGMVRDATWERIDWLVAHQLQRLAGLPQGPAALFRDPRDGRLWEKVHEHPQLRDGGPPRLTLLTPETAREKYGMFSDAGTGETR